MQILNATIHDIWIIWCWNPLFGLRRVGGHLWTLQTCIHYKYGLQFFFPLVFTHFKFFFLAQETHFNIIHKPYYLLSLDDDSVIEFDIVAAELLDKVTHSPLLLLMPWRWRGVKRGSEVSKSDARGIWPEDWPDKVGVPLTPLIRDWMEGNSTFFHSTPFWFFIVLQYYFEKISLI